MIINNILFFPSLTRQNLDSYKNNRGEFYSTYNCESNYNNILIDCKYRCVYCDAKVDECGGEPFSIDHFRPVSVFGKKFGGSLKIHPFNLCLSCQKCNVLKTNDWKGCREEIDGPTHIGGKGYIDRFQVNINNFITVDDYGIINSIDSSGPANYLIGKLLLNRTNRVYLRNLRAVKFKADIVEKKLIEKQKHVVSKWIEKKTSESEAQKQIEHITKLLERFSKLGLMKT